MQTLSLTYFSYNWVNVKFKSLNIWKKFQSPECTTEFLMRIRFRGQYASFFFAPLFIMIFIYGHIFIIIRRHQASRRALTQHNTLTTGGSRTATGETSMTSLRYHSSVSSRRLNPKTGVNNKRSSPSLRATSTNYSEDQNSTTAVTRNVKVFKKKIQINLF